MATLGKTANAIEWGQPPTASHLPRRRDAQPRGKSACDSAGLKDFNTLRLDSGLKIPKPGFSRLHP